MNTEIHSSIPIGKVDYSKSGQEIYALRHVCGKKTKQDKMLALIQEAMSICYTLNNQSDKKLPDDQKLPKHAFRLLYLLEARSFLNHGDCRWYDARMAEELGVSIRTVQRVLSLLHKVGFIQRFTERKYDPRRIAKTGNGFYCIRAIRVVRNFVYFDLDQLTQHQLGWKQDPRPDIKKLMYRVDRGWFVRKPTEFIDKKAHKVYRVEPKATDSASLVRMGLWSMASARVTSMLRSAARDGIPKAKKVMGSRWRDN